ncbi:hypothetical protein QYF36_017895 [Acer negundo]|nr:hypothetical protein QYF36_017895 [Acer negundo]
MTNTNNGKSFDNDTSNANRNKTAAADGMVGEEVDVNMVESSVQNSKLPEAEVKNKDRLRIGEVLTSIR